MLKKVIIEKNIEIEPKYLDKNILTNITSQFNYKNECTLKHGYINPKKIISIDSNIVTKTNNKVSFRVRFLAETFKPEKGMELTCNVNTIIPSGIFLDYEQVKIMVPLKNIKSNGYVYNKGIFTNEKDESNAINIGDKIKVIITELRFEKKKFICIASMKM